MSAAAQLQRCTSHKAPIPFVNKVNQASEKINPIAGGTIPDPNKPLSASGGAL